MVCLGNICRSPLAEGILRSKVNPSEVWVDSAGTAGYHIGSTPDPRSIAIARKYQIDISQQRCRKFSKEDFKEFDVIFAMDKENYNTIISLASNAADSKKVHLLLEGVDTNYTQVPDPYYGGEQGFHEVYNLVEKACNHIVLNTLASNTTSDE